MRYRKRYEAAFNLLCGNKIGEGIHRSVYECRLDPGLVVKVELSEELCSFANALEFHHWEYNQGNEKVTKWLAPCDRMDFSGLILIQKRVRPLGDMKLPKKLPSFLADRKPENFGIFDGRIVCCDYAILHETYKTKPTKARWR